MQKIFDGHNDLLLRLWRNDDMEAGRFLNGCTGGHIDLPRTRKGGLAGGFFAIYVPNEEISGGFDDAGIGRLDIPYLPPVDGLTARRTAQEMAGILLRLERNHPEALQICRRAADIQTASDGGAIAAIMHIEGAECIGPDLLELELFYAAGLRSIGPVWSRPNAFGYGVPFRHPGDPNNGPGLTGLGRDLVEACNRMNILVDLSHLNEAGFWDVARISDKPLVATHSNVHALSPSARNLTDRQLAAIAETGGLVGLNYAVNFLREDGLRDPDMPLELMLRHLDHLIGILGEGGVALGSDFDGATIPAAITDCAGLPNLVQAMRDHGWGEELIDRVCWRNWTDVLERTIG